jgi:acetyl-CoA acetyltransferase
VDENEIIERRACISGIGQSKIARRLETSPMELTLDACLAAIDDAGLTVMDIDGLSSYPGGGGGLPNGFSGAGAIQVHEALRLELDWYDSGIETAGQLGSVIKACLAVGAGLANHVLCFRSVWEGSAQGKKGRSAVMPGGGGKAAYRASGFMEWNLPFSVPSAAVWIALFAQRHFHVYGTTREQLAQIALNGRKNAALNPNAIYRDPMTMDDYMAARMISTPFCLFDCDVPCDGATAFIVSRIDRAKDLRHAPVRVEAVGTALHGRPSWDQFDDLSTMATRDAGAHLWTRTDLKPSDVDFAQLYDGFSFLTLSWLEALKLVPLGESGPFVEGGQRIARDGELPINTHGGQLSAGRLHGYGFLHEAVVQLRGDGGPRQIAKENPQVAVAAAGGGNTCGCMLLTRA